MNLTKDNALISNKLASKNGFLVNRNYELNNTCGKKSPNVNVTKHKYKNTTIISNSQILFNLSNESFAKRNNLQNLKDSQLKGNGQACKKS